MMNTKGFDAVFDRLCSYIEENSIFNDTDISTTKEGDFYPKIVVSDIQNSVTSKTTVG